MPIQFQNLTQCFGDERIIVNKEDALRRRDGDDDCRRNRFRRGNRKCGEDQPHRSACADGALQLHLRAVTFGNPVTQ